MAVETQTELIRRLSEGDFEAILGTRETSWLDFKEKPHDLDSRKGRRDLVADCAAFANFRGGVILCGVREGIDEGSAATVAESTRTVTKTLVDEDRIHDLVRANVRPLLQIELQWFESNGVELFALIVPPQSDDLGPFLVRRMADEEGDRDLPNAVGWPTRHGTGTHWEAVDRIQHLITDGIRARWQTNAMRTDNPQDQRESVLETHLSDIESRDEWQPWPYYVVSIAPSGPGNALMEDFYGGVLRKVQRWAGLRSNGFNLALDWGGTRLEAGEIRSIDDRRSVYISRSGVVTAAAVGSPEMLGWASHPVGARNLEKIIINPYVFTEFTFEAIRLAYEAVGPELSHHTGWTLRAVGRHLQGNGRPGLHLRTNVGGQSFPLFTLPPVVDSFDALVTVSDEDQERDTYQLVAEALGQGWALSRADVPFTTEGRISMETIAGAARG